MQPKDEPSDSRPPLDPFGTEDPYWERHYGISWLRRVARSRRHEPFPRPPGELRSVLVIAVIGAVAIALGLALLFWIAGTLIRLAG
jgi:hypothetical protein